MITGAPGSCTLDEARTILTSRAQQLTEPYILLSHALSGGILRDLLRYALQITEMKEKTRSRELTDISRSLVLEELAETLAGFRTLLSAQSWARDTSDVLSTLRSLCGLMHEVCPCRGTELASALEEFAFYGADGPPGEAAGQLAADARLLIDEASTYAYFSLTLLEIFGTEGLSRRTPARGAAGTRCPARTAGGSTPGARHIAVQCPPLDREDPEGVGSAPGPEHPVPPLRGGTVLPHPWSVPPPPHDLERRAQTRIITETVLASMTAAELQEAFRLSKTEWHRITAQPGMIKPLDLRHLDGETKWSMHGFARWLAVHHPQLAQHTPRLLRPADEPHLLRFLTDKYRAWNRTLPKPPAADPP
jgi:hypothetical protein